MAIMNGAALWIVAGLSVGLFCILTYQALRPSKRRNAGTKTTNPRAWLKGGTGDASGRRSDSDAAAREVQLCRQLWNGDLDADAYRQAMTDLTQRDVTRSRGLT